MQKQNEIRAVLKGILDNPTAEGLEINLQQLKDIIDVAPDTLEFRIKRIEDQLNEQNQVRQRKFCIF